MATAQSRTFELVDAMVTEYERKFDPWRVRLAGGWSAWALVRWAVAIRLAGLPLSPAQPGPGRIHRILMAIGDAAKLVRLGPSKVLVQTYVSALLEEDSNRFKDIWFDDLLAHLDSSVKVELINNPTFLYRRRHALRPADVTTCALDIASALLLRFQKTPAVAEAARELITSLRSEFGREAPDDTVITMCLAAFHWKRLLWGRLLNRVSPRVVLIADPGEFGLIAAAKERGILVAEIQHGLTNRYNPAYSWPVTAIPHRSALAIADRLYVHGEYWRREIAEIGFWGDALRVVGNPRVDQYRGVRSTRRKSERRTVVFTSQGIAVAEAATILARFAQAAIDRADLELIVKLHPVYEHDSSAYAQYLSAFRNVRIIAGSAPPSTFELIAYADLHISISSTTHYDAIALGVPTTVLRLPGYEIVTPLIAAGHASVADDAEELLAQATADTLPDLGVEVRDYYYCPGAVANILSDMTPLIEGRAPR